MASSSSSTRPARNQFRYHVFLSFRGKDTRYGFTSHLYDALRRKSISAFIDNKLLRGEKIADALWSTIEDSKMAVVIFSKNYATSRWCLDELAKIIECYRNLQMLVIPIFYHVAPSHVRKQTGYFARAFSKHRKVPMEKVQIWKDALTTAANLSGWASKDIRLESKLVDEISKDIFKKLRQLYSPNNERLVGMDSHIEQMMHLLSLESSDVRMVGIWGMAGIGKTTIAETIFDQIKCEFDASCFLKDVRENSVNRGLTFLAEQLLYEIVGEKDFKISTPDCGSYLIKNMLCDRKVLIVLDDVNKKRQLEVLAGDSCWFGSGSRIIITSRYKQVLNISTTSMYEVEGLEHNKALQLFSWKAFKQNHPRKDFTTESDLLVKYAGGNPLALKVLGSSLYRKDKGEWESAMKKLEKTPHSDIQVVLEISYMSLDPHDRQIFLHIACFFKGWKEDRVIQILDGCDFSSKIGISNLVDSSLVTRIGGELEMHDLVQGMGRAIVLEESTDPSKRSRLWDHRDIYQILKRNTGSETIEVISLDMSKLTRDLYLEPDVFVKMPNLKILKFYGHCKVKLGQGLESLPDSLRYLEWHGYPLKTLPANFEPENLIELKLPGSDVESLWDENKNCGNLKLMDPPQSQSLIKASVSVQAPSRARRIFEGMCKFISSMGPLWNLVCMRMGNCNTIENLPNDFVLPSLEILYLSGCLKLKKFPLVSRNIKELNLASTAIAEVPSSVECLSRLQVLDMAFCTELWNITNNICKLKSLRKFYLSHCSSLKNFPEILETMENMHELSLGGTGIEKLPLSIERLTNLSYLSMYRCKNLISLPRIKMRSLGILNLSDCSKLEMEVQNSEISEESMDDGHMLSKFLIDPYCFSAVTSLDLSDMNFERLPVCVLQLSRLRSLTIRGCDRLQSLLELPLSLQELIADDCRSLETVPALLKLDVDLFHIFCFAGCYNLDQNTLVAQAWLKLKHSAIAISQAYRTSGMVSHSLSLSLSLSLCY